MPRPIAAQPAAHRPAWFMAWGLVAVCMLVGGLALLRNESTRPNVGTGSPPQVVPIPSPPSDAAIDAASSFTTSVLDNGWTLYISDDEGFSIELPPGWRTNLRADLGPELKLSAIDGEPTYGPVSGGGSPGVFVMKHPVHEGEVPRLYYEVNRLQLLDEPSVVGDVQLTDTMLRDGRAYVLRAVYESPYGRRSETMYGLLLGSFDYRLHFAVPARHLNEYEGLFHDIASTFHVSTP